MLQEFVQEYNDLKQNGINLNGRMCHFSVHYICDAKARAKIKCIVEHGGRNAFEKCEVEGEWINDRMTFCNLGAP